MSGGSGDFLRVAKVIFEVKIPQNGSKNVPSVINPQKYKHIVPPPPPIGGVRGVGPPKISPPISVRKVYHGVGKDNHVVGKVYHGVGKVYHGHGRSGLLKGFPKTYHT